MTPMARTAPWAALVTEAARSCLLADPAWTGAGFAARPERGWRAYTGPDERTADANARCARGPARRRRRATLVRRPGRPAAGDRLRRPRLPLPVVGLRSARRRRARPGFDGDTDAALAAIVARWCSRRRSTSSIRRRGARAGGGDHRRALRRDPVGAGSPGGDEPERRRRGFLNREDRRRVHRPRPKSRAACPWRQAASAPSASTAAEQARPARRPPARSATKPTSAGPTIWPAANMIVKALIPGGPQSGGEVVAE